MARIEMGKPIPDLEGGKGWVFAKGKIILMIL